MNDATGYGIVGILMMFLTLSSEITWMVKGRHHSKRCHAWLWFWYGFGMLLVTVAVGYTVSHI